MASNALLDAVGTTLGLGAARWVAPQLEGGFRRAAEMLATDNPEAWHRLRHGWKLKLPFRGNVDKKTIVGSTVLNTVAQSLTNHLGPLGGTVDEVVERVVSELPQVLPRVFDPIAEAYTPRPGVTAPTNDQAVEAFNLYTALFFKNLPFTLVTFTGGQNPTRLLTRMGEQMQQAVNACGPIAVLAMSHIWMEEFNEADRTKYAATFYAMNTPTEVEVFLSAPNKAARKTVLDFYVEMKRLRLPITSDQAIAFLKGLKTKGWDAHAVPFLKKAATDLNDHAAKVRAKRAARRR